MNYYAIVTDKGFLHYGTPRHSGRYPWGSGEDPYQSSPHMQNDNDTTDQNVDKRLGKVIKKDGTIYDPEVDKRSNAKKLIEDLKKNDAELNKLNKNIKETHNTLEKINKAINNETGDKYNIENLVDEKKKIIDMQNNIKNSIEEKETYYNKLLKEILK